MTNLTDPAREILDLCKYLVQAGSTEAVQKFLAEELGVDIWSSELFLMIEVVTSRLEELRKAIDSLSLEQDLTIDAYNEINSIKKLLTPPFFSSNTMGVIRINLDESKLRTLRLLAPQVRTVISYPYIGDDERGEVSNDIRTLLEWLSKHQLSENDFIRGALIDGLSQALFRLEKMHFFGWAHSAASLKPVIAAYMALDRMDTSKANNPDAEIVLKRVREVCIKFYQRMKLGNEVVEVGDFALRVYGAASLAVTPFVGVAGLLR